MPRRNKGDCTLTLIEGREINLLSPEDLKKRRERRIFSSKYSKILKNIPRYLLKIPRIFFRDSKNIPLKGKSLLKAYVRKSELILI